MAILSDTAIAPAIVFSDMFRMAVIHLMHNIPADVSDEAAEAVMREVTDNIDANPDKLKRTINIIYARALEDEKWTSVAVKLLTNLCLLIPATLRDPYVPTDNNSQLCTGARLVRHQVFERLQFDLETDLQTTNWSRPLIWLLAELAESTASPLLMSQKTSIRILVMMAEAKHLFEKSNLDLFIEYVDYVAIGLDVSPDTEAELTRVLEQVRERTEKADEDLITKVKVTGLIALRQNGWAM